jgi:membrane protein YdbS with pleckstrin-like domain
MSTYKSKPAFQFILPLAIILGGFGFIVIYNKIWFALALIVILASLIAHMFITTCYQIEGTVLKIKSGFLFNKSIAIGSIRRVTATKTPLSSPATSLERLEIMYNKNDSIIISPKDKTGFINELKTINPGIDVE